MPRLIEFRGKMGRGNCHTHTLTKALPQRTSSHFDAGGESIFRVTRCDTPKLTEVFDVIKRHIIPRQMQQRIQEHRSMPTRKDEAVTSHPFGIAWIMSQVAS